VRLLSPVTMLNLLGDEGLSARVRRAAATDGVALHLYGKREARVGRKMGHANCLVVERDRALDTARTLHGTGDG